MLCMPIFAYSADTIIPHVYIKCPESPPTQINAVETKS